MDTRLKLVESYLERASEYYHKGEFDSAILDYNKVIELEPQNAVAYLKRGVAYSKIKNELDKAIADYSKAIDLDPKNAHAYFSRGFAYREKGELDKALSDYNNAIKLDPKNPDTYFNRALIYLKKGESDKARVDFNMIIKLHTINPQSVTPQFLEKTKNLLAHDCNYETYDLNWLTENDITHSIESARKKYSAISHENFSERAFLWKASKNQIHFKHGDTPKQYAPIYVFGTHHRQVGDDAIDRFDESFKSIVSSVHTVFTEVERNTDYKKIANIKSGNPANEGDPTDDVIYIIDDMFAAEAANQKKKLKPLENTKIKKICGSSSCLTLNTVRAKMDFYKNEGRNYLTNIDDRHISPPVGAINREHFWISMRILPASESGQPSLVAGGNGHKHRVLRMLVAEGYTLEPLMKQAPTPRSEIVKFLFYGNSPLKFFKQRPEIKKGEETETKSAQLQVMAKSPNG